MNSIINELNILVKKLNSKKLIKTAKDVEKLKMKIEKTKVISNRDMINIEQMKYISNICCY
jgi:hypothetical protein